MTINTQYEPRFELGEIFISKAARKAIGYVTLLRALCDHARGWWGQCDRQEIEENDQAIQDGGEIFSRFDVKATTRTFYIITNESRTKTEVVTSDEY